MPTLCLCMIVKNEEAVISRCLQSVRPLIDHWIICDTGSTDKTKEIIKEELRDVPGELHERPWVGFAHNRTEAVAFAKGKADYLLIADADMVVNTYGEFKQNLTADAYLIRYEGDLDYRQLMLLSNRHDWKYVGVTHEYIWSATATLHENLDTLTLTHYCDGSARKDKTTRDIALLQEGLREEPDNARYMFYLAQSYRDAGQYNEALEWYKRRVEAGGWTEEVWYSLYQIGRLRELLGNDWASVLEAFLKAYDYNPARLEPLYCVVKHYRENRQYDLGYLFSRNLDLTSYPKSGLFIEKDIYTYKFPLECAICSHWVGKYPEAIQTYNNMLDRTELPSEYREAAVRNRAFALDKIYKKPHTAPPGRNKIKVLVTVYNPGQYLDACVGSLLSQDYDNFQIVFADDVSTDGSASRVPVDDPRVTLIRNDVRLGAAKNLHRLLRDWCEPDDIAVLVDGDDWLACPDALAYIDRFYREHDCWVMYGQFRYSTGHDGMAKPYPDREAFEHLRGVWYASHIKTFRAGVYHKIEEQDPMYSCMKDATGKWYTAAPDMALMYPVLELAGFDRVRYSDKVLYVYNVGNPLSVSKTRRDEQVQENLEIVAKKPFRRVDSLCGQN